MSESEGYREAVILIYRRVVKEHGQVKKIEHDYYCPTCDFWFIDCKGALSHITQKHKADWVTFKIRQKPTLDDL